MPEEEEYDYSEGEQPEAPSDPGLYAIKNDQFSSYRPNFSPTNNGSNLIQFPGSKKATNAPSSPLKGAENVKSPTGSGIGAGFTNGAFGQNNLSAAESATPSETYGGGVNNFTNAVSGKNAPKVKGKGRGFLKKISPAIAILAFVAGIGGSIFLGQASLPFSFLEQVKTKFNSLETTTSKRSKVFTKLKLNPEDRTYSVVKKAKYFGKDKFSISSFQKKKLAKAGITVEGSNLPGKNKTLKWNDYTIVADQRLADPSKKVVYIDDMYRENQNFARTYDSGTKSWRTSVSKWFDKLADKFLKKLGGHRGMWSEFQAGDKDSDAKAKQTIGKNLDGDFESDVRARDIVEDDQDLDSDGNPKQKPADEMSSHKDSLKPDVDADVDAAGSAKGGKKFGRQAIGAKLKNIGNAKLARGGDALSQVANIGCAITEVIGAIGLAVAGYQTAQVILLAMSYLEAFDKAKAGDGNASPINELSTTLQKPATSTYETTTSVDNNTGEATGSTTTTLTGAATQAESYEALYSGKPVNGKDPSVASFNIGSTIKNIFFGLGVTATSYQACTTIKMATSALSAAKDGVMLIACIFTLGAACAIDAAIEAGIGLGLSTVIAGVVSFLVPFVAGILNRNFRVGELAGVDLGNALVNGSSRYVSENHLTSGGSVADKTSLLSFRNAQTEVIAENARSERLSRSPFDITSPYTFVGSLATKMIPLATSTHTISSAVTNISSIAAKSFSSLLPGASAVENGVDVANDVKYTEEHCPELHDIGGVGGPFCEAYIVSDLTTIEDDPAEVVARVDAIDDNFEDVANDDENAVPVIKDGSPLARYVVYCGQRQSPWGFADQNVASSVASGYSTGNTVGDSIIGAVPVIGDVLDMASQKEILENFGYVSGQSCVTNNDSSSDFYKSDSWSNEKYYQRFIEDQRQAESEGDIEESAVSEYLSRYYEKHPLDNSFEGIIARRSGLTRENVELALNYLELFDFLANYEPDGLLPVRASESDDFIQYSPDSSPTLFARFSGFLSRSDLYAASGYRRQYAVA